MTGPFNPDVETPRPAAAPPIGDGDESLIGWRDAAEAGALPLPPLRRWQPLRAGVVNLWEFDVAEYWFAGGRAQLVGQNQSGKSTLMALTTLIMLAGDLDRQFVDTFGEQQKSFRYYVEPTDDPKDRRSTEASTSRGWAWVEYGRLADDGTPEYFTTMLYAQAKRGANDFTKKWAVCGPTARVRDGLVLAEGSAVAALAEVDAAVDEFRVATSGTEYKTWQAKELFGFADTQRMDVVVRMLKVLRTPHLGQKLDPDFLTSRMRDALPSIDRDEIDELAEGWDQLDRLAADKDNAENALKALKGFIKRGWEPWANATIRRYADDLAAATTRLDDVTREDRRADADLTAARDSATETADEHEQAKLDHQDAVLRYDEHLRSSAYRDAVSATNRIESLTKTAEQSQRNADTLSDALARAEKVRGRRAAAVEQAVAAVEHASTAVTARAADARATLPKATLADEAPTWLDQADTARLLAACRQQKGRVRDVRTLLRAAERKDAAAQLTEQALLTAEQELKMRTAARTAAETALDTELQHLSDAVESWALGLDESPSSMLRQEWLDAVTTMAGAPRPGSMLSQLVRSTWLTAAITPLTDAAALAEQAAKQLTADADAAGAAAEAEEARPDPEPAPPSRWTRRNRPAPSSNGAPLWRALDPAPGLAQQVLDRVEAALDACGLLDAWVTPDGAWVADRDGDDNVLQLTTAAGQSSDTGALTLGSVLQVAADAGPLTNTAAALLARIGWQSSPSSTVVVSPAGYGIMADGRWQTPTAAGRAAAAADGAELLGTAARAAARARRAAQLREQAGQLREQAAAQRERAAGLRARVAALTTAADDAPSDSAVVAAAHARTSARAEADRAQGRRDDADTANRAAVTARDDAYATLLQTAATHRLPHTDAGLDDASVRLDTLTSAVTAWENALTDARHADQLHTTAQAQLAEATEDLTATEEASRAADRKADEDARRVDVAREALSEQHANVLEREEQLKSTRETLSRRVSELAEKLVQLRGAVIRAEQHLEQSTARRQAAETERDNAAAAWWVLVDTRLPELRGIESPASRSTRSALDMARTARDRIRPPQWSSDPDIAAKDRAVTDAWTSLVTKHLPELRLVLEASGGRTVAAHTREETGTLESVAVRVDATSDASDPITAAGRLAHQIDDLAKLHDAKMNSVLVELLSSTFVEHLRDRLTTVIGLLARVNKVLAAHPTGATRTLLRLRRVPAENQKAGYEVLEALSGNVLGDAAVQDQVRNFLKQQILEAQDRGRDSALDWKDHLAQLLDYRTWFAVTTQYKVEQGDDRWHPLTKEVHGRDSGGGKVVTLLQPLLSTLVALYGESELAPRPLWLDEAFTGVDAANRATMLDLVVNFDLDFLLAGPETLAATAHVPSAAIWSVNRAPAPLPGVDLSLTLWAGNTLYPLTTPDPTLTAAASASQRKRATVADRLSLFDGEELEATTA